MGKAQVEGNRKGGCQVKKVNFRVSDTVKETLEQLTAKLQNEGTDVTLSEVMRLVMAEGLKNIKGQVEASGAAKGAKFERWVVKRLEKALPAFEFEHLRPEQGKRNPDILGPFCAYECKTGKRPSTRTALAQVLESDRGEREPVAIIRDDNGHAFVVLPFDSFLKFLKAFGVLAKFASETNGYDA